MKICKVKPNKDHCCCCIDEQIDNNTTKDCDLCIMSQPDSELLNLETSIFGKLYAFVLMDGKIKKVAVDRLRNIRDKEM